MRVVVRNFEVAHRLAELIIGLGRAESVVEFIELGTHALLGYVWALGSSVSEGSLEFGNVPAEDKGSTTTTGGKCSGVGFDVGEGRRGCEAMAHIDG